MAFAFEKLIVYQKSVDLADQVTEITGAFPRGFYFLADQLNRASLSISANIAEGKSIDQACAPFVRKPTAGNMIRARLKRYLKRERERCAAGDISPTTLKELDAVSKRNLNSE